MSLPSPRSDTPHPCRQIADPNAPCWSPRTPSAPRRATTRARWASCRSRWTVPWSWRPSRRCGRAPRYQQPWRPRSRRGRPRQRPHPRPRPRPPKPPSRRPARHPPAKPRRHPQREQPARSARASPRAALVRTLGTLGLGLKKDKVHFHYYERPQSAPWTFEVRLRSGEAEGWAARQ